MDGLKSLMSPDEAADYLNVTKIFLAQRRCSKLPPAYIKIGRLIRYRRDALEAFVSANTHCAA